jgi:ABC-type dipeptide/oligopeptide/nickel transport system permease subunit
MKSQPARREAWWSLLLGIVALVILSFAFAQILKGLR